MTELRSWIPRFGRTGRDEDDAPDSDRSVPDRGRRAVLAAGGCGAAALLAGCSALPVGNTSGEGSRQVDNTTTTATATASPTPPDPSETDVKGLVIDSKEPYRFSVTLDAAAEPGGADWWQVETLGGERVYRHEFAEPRSSRVTSSGEFEAPDGADGLVVRGHGHRSGYGGRVILYEPGEGTLRLEKQGAEPESFEDYTF